MEKKKIQLSDDSLNGVSGGKVFELGNWSYDIKCPFCNEDQELQQGLQMYSDQSGLSIVYCMKCRKPFGFNEKGETFAVNYQTVD